MSKLHDLSEPGLLVLNSEYEFYDLFVLLKEKFRINIPSTALMKGGNWKSIF